LASARRSTTSQAMRVGQATGSTPSTRQRPPRVRPASGFSEHRLTARPARDGRGRWDRWRSG
jgi:hypothetical protein